MRPVNFSALLTLAFCLTVVPAIHAASYDFAPFDVPGASSTRALGINDRGVVVGQYGDQLGVHGFLFDGKTLTTIDVPEALGTTASAINNRGDIVGSFNEDSFRTRGFLFKRRQFTVIDAPFPDAGDTLLGGINNRGQIVGGSLFIAAPTPELSNERGFFFEDEEFQPIPIARPSGINNRGEIVGDDSIFADGVLTPLLFPGAIGTSLLGINNRGDIVGAYQISGEGRSHGFIYVKGIFSTIDVPFANATDTFPTGINNRGEIVGIYFADDNTAHSFTASPAKPQRKSR